MNCHTRVLLTLALLCAPRAGNAHDVTPVPAPTRLKSYLMERDPAVGITRAERIALGTAASAAALAAALVGAGFGVVSVLSPGCVDNAAECFQSPSPPDLSPRTQWDGRARGERRLLLADVSFFVAGAFVSVAIAAMVTALWPYTWWPMAGQ